LKPANSCRGEGRTEQQEENPNRAAQWRELLVRHRIENPDTIKSRASPEQSSCGETRHNGAKEQENADCGEAGGLSPDSEIEARVIVVTHLLNISQGREP